VLGNLVGIDGANHVPILAHLSAPVPTEVGEWLRG